ncbi:MAG: tRNA (adenosine(37)-N6)-threonylcarbamoyltransferase complex ATPase subunit type 1 TsaE [Candidatus Staskawiczbacteria bacterium]|nr:tRNA (adenosine(37)-N6)-threonylcarbamoyltransferase complex ATPase subunit type 1 TsaE [Candidatus Staskawiczbacteria bacterium]
MLKKITKSIKQTQKIGEEIAKGILKLPAIKTATVLGLHGNLGAGKTTFLQGFAKGLKIKDKVLSPTFVIQKRFKIKDRNFKNFYHIDCYRLKDHKDMSALDFKEIISDPENIIAIEWPGKIKKVLPKGVINIDFRFIDDKTRELTFK